MIKLGNIEILENDRNKKGDLFGRLIGDLFHAMGYDEPRLNIHKTGREIDISAVHRTEKKVAIAECKAHKEKVGGDQINKFCGVLDGEKRKLSKLNQVKEHNCIGFFVSLSGFKETAIEQEKEFSDDRVILVSPSKIVEELILGRIIVPIEQAVSNVSKYSEDLDLCDEADLLAYKGGWVWAIYYSDNKRQTKTHFALIHAEGNYLINELVDEILILDSNNNNILSSLYLINPKIIKPDTRDRLLETKEKYFEYVNNECGEIQFEGLPTDKDAGAVKVKLENIFVPLYLVNEKKEGEGEEKNEIDEEGIIDSYDELIIESEVVRESIGDVLSKTTRIAILAKPGGGKSTLIKRIATAYAFPDRRDKVEDGLPNYDWFPIFIRCRELGDRVTGSITEIIHGIPNRAELNDFTEYFKKLVSQSLQTGKALLLIDGLDEISDEKDRVLFVNQLRTFLATYPNINIIVTSREAGFRSVGGYLANYCNHYHIANLDERDISDLCIKWHTSIIDTTTNTVSEAKNIASLIIKDFRIRVLAENPLLLTTLLFVKRWAGYIPTKKTVLYQEMIKLLLVTWNVEGYEQLEIEETEPQLAYTAFWMSKNGQQTITDSDLKNVLTEARRDLPEILGYTKISVPDFIKRVEFRSSLLIMIGHKRNELGSLEPIYEFLHLSFQEFLTAKAIAERFLPKELAGNSLFNIIFQYTEKGNWKEIIPQLAVLSKRENTELIEYLIKEANREARGRGFDVVETTSLEVSYVSLLLNCLINEIQIRPEQLKNAIESIAKGMEVQNVAPVIANSKFGEAFYIHVVEIFFARFDDLYSFQLSMWLSSLWVNLRHQGSYSIKEILYDILNSKKQEKCIALIELMNFVFDTTMRKSDDSKIVIDEEVFLVMIDILKTGDPHYYFTVGWCLAWIENAALMPEKFRQEIVNIFIEKWLISYEKESVTDRITSWVLSKTLRPQSAIFCPKEQIRKIAIEKYRKPNNHSDASTAIFVGLLLEEAWARKELQELGKGKKGINVDMQTRDFSFKEFIKAFG